MRRHQYHMILKERNNPYVPCVKFVILQYMRDHEDYFGEALDLCEQFGISNIISFNKDFDAELLAQFYATVYFTTREDRSIAWMCHDERMSCTWESFMKALNI